MADVIRTSAESPVSAPPRERVEPLLSPLVNEMYARFGENTTLLSRAEERGDYFVVGARQTTRTGEYTSDNTHRLSDDELADLLRRAEMIA